MKKAFSLALMIGLIAAMLSFAGCKNKDPDFYWGPIEGWEDIAMPDDAEWERSRISGPVENHTYIVDLPRAETFHFMEKAMGINGWTLSSSLSNGRTFIKEGHTVTMSIPTEEGVTPVNLFIIIEPAGAYEEIDEEEDES